MVFVTILEIVIGAFVALAVPYFIPESRRNALTIWATRAIGVVIMLFAIVSTSYVHVPDGHFAQVFKTYGGSSLTEGRIVAVSGEKGPQGYVIRPGFHPQFLINVINTVDTSKKEHVVPDGQVGVLTAKDGAPLRPGQAFADPFPAKLGYAMLDAETFLKNKGQRGPQLTVLTPGSYVLNDYLWKVENMQAKEVTEGHAASIKSNVWASVDLGTIRADKPAECKTATRPGDADGHIDAPVVPDGCVGIWKSALLPGKYYFNPNAFSTIELETRAQVWTYAGGYQRCDITLEVDSKGEIKQERKCARVDFDPRKDADRAVFVKMEGWDIPLELRVVAQVSPENVSCVVAGVGSLQQIEDRVLTPSIRAIVRDVAGGTYEVTEAKVDETGKPVLDADGKPIIQTVNRPTRALDLINQRPLIEGEIERRIRPEALKSCVTIREVRLGEPAIPPELLVAVRREQLATQLAKAYIQEQQAQTKRIDSEQAKQTANQQETLVKAQIGVKASEQDAIAARNVGLGERDKLTLIAEGQKKQLDVLGAEATVSLRRFELALETVAKFADKNPNVIATALSNAHKFVPNVQVGASGGDSGLSGLFAGMMGNAISGQVPTIAAPVNPPRR